MKDSTAIEQPIHSVDERTISIFGYELIRDILIPEILGKDTHEILYWAGKRLARKFPLEDFDALIDFFSKASWGQLLIIKESKNQLELELMSPRIAPRVKSKAEQYFQLEAGFLAQQIEFQKQVATAEAFEHPIKKSNKVHFTVKWEKQ
ncbi:YslB family protein [Bacillus sp. BRMEA1]|uniref:YslB family protein n=1 Tax=Neobacillus endophyticus TaxID=2738405 RepID=UPI001565AB83|nr:YslB family protein [Neobacillus endophyticus]NRD76047.1 YslB family protein [Neobacillus endophyticus]